MIKLLTYRSARIALLFVVAVGLGLSAFFMASPDLSSFRPYVISKLKKELQAQSLDISRLHLDWEMGPLIQLGQLSLEMPALSVQDAYAEVSWSIPAMFFGEFTPELNISGGVVALNLDAGSEQESASPFIAISLDDVQLQWTLQQEQQMFHHVSALLSPDLDLSFHAEGVDLQLSHDFFGQLETLQLEIKDFSGLPRSWMAYAGNLQSLSLDVADAGGRSWQWQLAVHADDGAIVIPEAHVNVPLNALETEGILTLQRGKGFYLQDFTASSLHWQSGENFGDFILNWQNDNLHIQAKDGSTSMPMLWSWLWMLGDEGWHQWLNSMQHGRLSQVDATLDLVWKTPLHAAPSMENVRKMIYHVTTYTEGADIALGLNGDYLNLVDAYVEIDQDQLQATIVSAELNEGVGMVSGEYAIRWDSLMMDIHAQGGIDLGKLHRWLEPDSARDLHWGKAPSIADVLMQWDVRKSKPDQATATVVTDKPWHLKPLGSPMVVHQGVGHWDINKGLQLENLQVDTPWFNGKLNLFLNEKWSLEHVQLEGVGPLAKLTEQFSLPIVHPSGQTGLRVNFDHGKWSGNLDFSRSDWDSFAGFDKRRNEKLKVKFSGKAEKRAEVLPIQIQHLDSAHKDFEFKCGILIDKKKLDFQFRDIVTPALRSDLRLLVPFDERLPWGLEMNADYIDRPALKKYLSEVDKTTKLMVRPWNINATADWIEWGENYAEDVQLQLSSTAEQQQGSFSTGYMATEDADLDRVSGSFTKLKSGKFELHHIEADNSGQHVVVSGSALPAGEAYAWQGMVLVDGEFGRLMKQAELNQLFKGGKMHSVLLGRGKYKEGEPWWRELEGSFRLRVDDGRIMEGGTLARLSALFSLPDLPLYLFLSRGDVVGSGMLYDRMQLEAQFKSELLQINKLELRSSALDAVGEGQVNLDSGHMDVMLIARPLQYIEKFVGNIPLLGVILAGEDKSFLRKVYHIHGPASDAEVDEMEPEEAGLPESGLLETIFSLPGQLLGD